MGGEQQIVVSATGGTARDLRRRRQADARDAAERGASEGALNLFESAAVGDLDGGGGPRRREVPVDLGQAANLLLVGQNVPYSHRIGAFDARRARRPGFPVITDDYQFLSSSTVAEVAGGARTRCSPARASGCCTPTTA